MTFFHRTGSIVLSCGLGLLGAIALPGLAAAGDDAAFQAGIAQLRVIQQAIAQGKLADAKAACLTLIEKQDVPAHHRWEAEERRQEIERLEKGLPARDPNANRVALPKRPTPAITLYVAPDGDDANPGTQEKPFRTLERARDKIRAVKQAGGLPVGGVEVVLRGGEYKVTQTFELIADDSGTQQSPVVYRAKEGESPRFTGGLRLTGFQPVRDDVVLARLPEESRGKVICVDLKPLGVDKLQPLELGGFGSGRGFKTHPTPELFFDGRAMTLARWPNQGCVKTDEVSVPEPQPVHGSVYSKTGQFKYTGDRPERWQKENDAWLYGYWFWDWADSYERIASIDPAKHEITLVPPYHNYGYRKGQSFFAVNLLAELDSPGEWYLDRTNSTLYFWPPSDPDKAVVELSLNEFPFVETQAVAYVVFEGLTWELGGGDAVQVHGGEHCLITGCTVRRCGGNGVTITGGTSHGILSCDIHSLGRGGTVVTGGDRKTLTPGRHFVENCRIFDLSRIDRTYTAGVVMNGAGNRIAHNCFHDIPSSAIRCDGNDHCVEYNEAYRVVLESDDQGGIDMFGDPTFRGNVLRFNYWHHIGNWEHPNEGTGCGQGGIRLDDAISGVLIYGNVFYRASSGKHGFGGVQIHGGKDNILDNNLFVDCEAAISLSPWDAKRWKDFTQKSLESPKIDRTLYLAKYPDLASLQEDGNRNTIARSLVVQCRSFFRRDSHQNQLFDNLETAENPGFLDAAQQDFRLDATSSQAAQIGFRPIPIDEIGLYIDPFRREIEPRTNADGRK